MKSTILGVGLAFACAVTLGAQSTSPTQSYPSSDTPKQMSSDKAKDKKDKKSVTLSGCLREGDAPGEFVLANVDMSQMSGMKGHDTTSTTTPSGTSGSTGSWAGDKASKITLVSAASVNLKEHVGHRVEVTGTLAGMDKDKSKTPTGTTGSAAGETTSDTTSRTGSGERGMGMKSDKDHKMTVQSLKHVSATCTP